MAKYEGKLRKLTFSLPSYFGINLYFLPKKTDFRAFFPTFYDQRSVAEAWTNPCPWSIKSIVEFNFQVSIFKLHASSSCFIWIRLRLRNSQTQSCSTYRKFTPYGL